jgi:IS5 family transposase
MLRLYFVQLWYNFSDEGTEDALYDMPVLARFVGIDLTSERVVRLLSVASLKKEILNYRFMIVLSGFMSF